MNDAERTIQQLRNDGYDDAIELIYRLAAERDDWRREAKYETDVAGVACDEVKRLKSEKDAALDSRDRFWNELDQLKRNILAVEAERDAAVADADRYRKIEALAAGTPEQWQVVEDAAFASHWGCIQNFAINIDAIADMKEQEQGK